MGIVHPPSAPRVFVCVRLSLLKLNEPLRLECALALCRSLRSARAQFKHLSSRLLVASLVSAALSLPRIVVLFLEQWSSLHFRAISPSVLATNYPSAVKALYQPHCRPFTSRPRQSRSVTENLLPATFRPGHHNNNKARVSRNYCQKCYPVCLSSLGRLFTSPPPATTAERDE